MRVVLNRVNNLAESDRDSGDDYIALVQNDMGELMSKTGIFVIAGLVLAGIAFQVLGRIPSDALNVAFGVIPAAVSGFVATLVERAAGGPRSR